MESSVFEKNNLSTANDEVMLKIGRNMLLLQQLEGILKQLLAGSFCEGTLSTIRENQRKYASQINKKSLGQLVSEFCDRSLKCPDDSETEHVGRCIEDFHIKFHCSIECDQHEYEHRKQVLADIVQERNNLIHHLLPTYNPNSIEGLTELSRQFDEQYNQVLKETEYLSDLIKRFNELRKQMAAFLLSDKGERLLVEGLLPGESHLERLLSQLATLAARTDGWASLTVAGNLVKELNPQLVNKAMKEQGLSSLKGLKKLIESSDRFDLKEENHDKGSQWFFRPKIRFEEHHL